MPPFDVDAYFAARAQESNNVLSKLDSIANASREKTDSLETIAAQKQADLAAVSVVGQLGLNPNGFVGRVVNTGASLVSGASRMVGQVASLPVSALGESASHYATPEDIDAYNRFKTGAATSEDTNRLTRPRADGETMLSRFQTTENFRKMARSINDTTNLEGLVHQGARQELGKDLAEGFKPEWDKIQSGKTGEVVSGIAGLLMNAGSAIIHNKQAVAEYVAENVPQLFVGLFGRAGEAVMGASNIGYAVDTFQKGMENYAKANGGQLPDQETQQRMAVQAASLAIAEQAGDMVGLSATKLGSVFGGAEKKAARDGFLQSIKQVGKAAATGVATEAPTEGYQTYMEGQITGENGAPADVYAGAVIGGASGGALSGGGRLVAEATGSTPEKIEKRVKAAGAQRSVDAAIVSGDITNLVDPKHPDYAPDRAVAALMGNATLSTATDEQKQANLKRAGEVVETLAKEQERIQENYNATTPEAVAELKKQIAAANAAGKTEVASLLQEDLDYAAKEGTRLASELAVVNDRLEKARSTFSTFNEGIQAKVSDEALAKDISVLTTPQDAEEQPTPEVRKFSADRVINLAMAVPERVDTAVVDQLVADENNGISPLQRDYLKALSERRATEAAHKSTDDVHKEVLVNEDGSNVSNVMYRRRISAAIASGNEREALIQLKGLERFARTHQSKSEAFSEAWSIGKGTQVVRSSDGVWSVPERRLNSSEFKAQNGKVANSPRLVENIGVEAKVLSAYVNEARAAIALKFQATPTQQGANNVENVSQPHTGSTDQAPAAQPQAPVAGSTEGRQGDTSGSTQGTGTPGVETAGVTSEPVAVTAEPTPIQAPTPTPTAVAPAPVAKVKLTPLEKDLKQANRDKRRAAKQSMSLWSAVKHSLNETDLTDIYSSDWKKRFTTLRGKPGTDLSTLVANGSLDAFLPHNMRFGTGLEQASEQDAVEHIKEKLRNRDYLTEDTKNLMAQIDLTIEQLEEALSIEAQENEIKRTQEEIDREAGTGNTEEVATEATDGSAAGNEATQGTPEQSVKSPAEKTAVDSGVSDTVKTADNESKSQSTESTTVEPETDSSPDVTESSETTAQTGILDVFTDASETGTAFKTRNLIKDFFTLSAGSEDSATKRPLAAVKNFLSQHWDQATEFLQLDSLSEAQSEALTHFASAAKKWQKKVEANLPEVGNKDFRFADQMKFFIHETEDSRDIEENIKTAISYAAYSYVVQAAGRPRFNDDEAINRILERDETTDVTEEERRDLRSVGLPLNQVTKALGQQVVQALGLNVSKDAPQDLMPRLQSTLGAHALKLLMDNKLVVREEVSGADMAVMMGKSEGNQHLAVQFVRLNWDEKGKLSDDAQAITDTVRGTQGVLDKLFGVESARKEPSLAPVKFTQPTTKNTNQRIPEVLVEIINRQNAVPNHLRQDMWHLMQQLDPNIAMQIAGGTDISGTVIHAANLESVQAKNDSLEREIQSILDFYTDNPEAMDSPIYFEHSVWKQQRVGIATNVINPQSSKVHRHMLYMPEWETKVSLDDAAAMENLKLRIAEGLGIKTDKKDNTESLETFKTKIGEPEIRAAVKVLRDTIYGGMGMTPEMQQTLLAGVKTGGEKMHSLDALTSLAHLEHAQATEAKFVTIQMMGEVDGVTNGPMLSHLLMGAAESVEKLFELINRGGFFQLGSKYRNYNTWRGDVTNGHLDLYETTIKNVLSNVREMVKLPHRHKEAINPQKLAAIYAFTGELESEKGDIVKAGRNIIKTPLTAMVFGSSLTKAIDSMANGFVESVYSAIEDLAKGKGGHTREGIIRNLQILDIEVSNDASVADLLQGQFDKNEVGTLKKAFQYSLGKAVKVTMQQDFAVFMENRKQFNEAAQVTFHLYNSVYETARQQMIEDLIVSGGIEYREVSPKDANGKAIKSAPKIKEPLHDLTPAQEAELRKKLKPLEPVMHTLMSKDSGSLAAGLIMSKTAEKTQQSKAYESVVHFGNAFEDNGAKSVKTRSSGRVFSSPGVAMMPMAMHSLDSAISHYAAKLGQVLNVHDAHGTGLATFTKTAQNLNESAWNALLNYSPAMAVEGALHRTILGMASLIKKGEVSPETAQQFMAALKKQYPQETNPELRTVVELVRSLAYNAEKTKLQTLLQMGFVDQYALQGGEYQVTDEDRDKVQTALDSLVRDLDPRVDAAVNEIAAFLNEAGNQATTKVVQEEMVDQDPAPTEADALNTPATLALPVLQYSSQDSSLPAALRKQLGDLLTAMASGAMSLKEAIAKSGLNTVDLSVLAQTIGTRVAKMKAAGMTVYGKLGQPVIQADPAVVAFFEAAPDGVAKASDVIAMLNTRLANAGGKHNDLNRALLRLVAKTVDPNMEIRAISKNTDPSLVDQIPATEAHGWYSVKNSAEKIFLLGPDFVNTGMRVDTILHELVHAALVASVDSEIVKREKNPAHVSEVTKIIDELDDLRAKIAQDVPAAQLTQFKEAMSSTHEFISWGMTNLEFQRIINKVQMPSDNRKTNTLVSGMRAFIKNLARLLFKGSTKTGQEIVDNGLTTLIANVSGLFYNAAQVNKGNQEARSVLLAQDASTDPIGVLNTYSTMQLMDALNPGNISSGFGEHLKGLLSGIVHKLHGSYGSFKAELMENQAITPLDVWLKALDTGVAPFASKVLGSPLQVSEQEAFTIEQVEATMLAALNDAAMTKVAYAQLKELFNEARTKLKGNPALTQAQYDFIFTIEQDASGRSDYLARFAALGLAHEGFNKLMNFNTKLVSTGSSANKTWGERLQTIFENILEFFHGQITGTYAGQKADAKLTTLVGHLVDIEAKKRRMLADRAMGVGLQAAADRVATMGRAAQKNVTDAINNVVGSRVVQESQNAFWQLAKNTASTMVNNRLDSYFDGLARLRDKHLKERYGLAAGIVNAVRGPKDWMQVLLRSTKNLERLRKAVITDASKASMSAFDKAGERLTQDDKKAITKVLLRTGAHNLFDAENTAQSLAELERLISDPAVREAAVAALEGQLSTFGNLKPYFIKQANALGYYKATGEVKSQMLMMNAGNIARLYGTRYTSRITEEQATRAEAIIKKLVALYAISYTDKSYRDLAKEVLRTESSRTDGQNGVEFLLKFHRRLEDESSARLFGGSKALMMHGHVPEIYNPHTDIKVANDADGEGLELMGYVKQARVASDPNDPDRDVKHIYVLKDGGLRPYQTGAISTTSRKAKGTTQHNGFTHPDYEEGLYNAQLQATITNAKTAAVHDMFRPGDRVDLSKVTGTYLAPVVNSRGNVVNWRYLMQEDTKDDILERTNSFDEVVGMLAGSIFDKESSVEQNQKVIDALKEDAEANQSRDVNAYVEISPVSSDPEMREIWSLLPDETQRYIRSTVGQNKLFVRRDSLDVVFGYRKLSLADMYKKDFEHRNMMEQLFTRMLGFFLETSARARGMSAADAERYAGQAAVLVARGERMWQEVVREAKDIIVVRSFTVLWGNIKSNLSLLLLRGVSPKLLLSSHLVAFKGATAYRRDSHELAQIKLKLEAGYGLAHEAEMRQRVAQLEDSLQRNPVRELIEAGLMPTIVEDVSQDDNYSYKSMLTRKVEGVTSKMNPKILWGVKQVLMTEDTKPYQALSHMTQLSDFVARYALYQHLTTRAENPLSKERALQEASDSFINYDIPMQRGLQYMDDMGITMFTKYFLYVQRVISRLFREHPANVMAAVALGQYTRMDSIVLNSSALHRIGNNPLEPGAFKIFEAYSSLASVNGMLGLIK